MAELNANINVGIETTQALNQLKALQKQISQFHQSVAKSSGEAAVAQRDLQRNFLNSVNSIQGFSAELKTVRTTAESFTNSLEKNKFSMREYFRYAAGSTKTFGKNFKAEFSTIEKTAIERVKTLQTQYIKMGRDASGAMQAIAVRPTVLNMKDLGTQTAIAAQKQVIFNQLVKQGSTNLLNFGKNTQWAGRQLMVGFTLPLATLGMTAGRVFFDMEKAAIKFKKVYGDLFTAPEETKKAMDSIVALGEAYATYGIAVSDTLDLAADAAAAGFAGVDLQNQTTAALKLSVLGQLDLQKSLETTISLQNAFQLSSADLSAEIDFLNAVENQTVVALEDITTAVPRVAPVIQALGGDVRDLAFFLAAMKEGGVNAAQGANALKSGLASLINPSEKAATMLAGLGVNIRGIISQNQGDLAGTVFEFAKALDKLDPLRRAQAIEQLFGKFQFARISALFDNITRDGTQAQRVLDLAGSSAAELAALSESELGVSAASSMNKFRKSIEEIKVALVPIGELFVEIATPFVEFGTQMLKAFNKLPDGVKTVIGSVITILGGIGPIALMTFGLINNGIANMIKFFATVRLGYLKITGQAKGVGDETQYMTQEQLEAAAAAASLDQAHAGLTQRFTAETVAVEQLRAAYEAAAAAGARFAALNPGMMRPVSSTQAQGFANGGVVRGPGTGTSDSIPAMLSNGEAVIPAKQVKEYAPLIEGMIAGNIPGFAKGVMLGMPKSGKATAKNREAADAIYQEFLKSSYANTPPTEYGHQISPTSGHSFPIFGLGGVYEKGGKRVFVKPVMDETAALAEIRGTQITRQAHGLQAPEQRIVVIRDPMDPTRERRFLALESDLDAKFIQNEPKALFNEEQYFRQLVASLVRVDKDLAAGNVFGDVVADVGPAGVFDRASGIRALKTDLPSMEEQAMINLLGIKGGAKRAFAESTLALMAGLTPEQYHQRMLGEIQRVLPALKKTVAEFGLSNPTEAKAYDAMIKRLETGLGVDWSKFHSVHSGVKIAVPKKPKAVPGYANGVVSVPGQKGQGDTVPAMLSPGEAVIPAKFAKKYAPLINAMVAGNIPGYSQGKSTKPNVALKGSFEASHFSVAKVFVPIQDALDSLRENAKEDTALYKNLVAAKKAGVTEVRGYTNEVVALSKELNQAMERKGKASTDLVKKDVAGPASADMHVELERQLKNAGLNESQIKERINKLNAILQRKLDEFGDKAEVTADELNELISDGYDELSQTDKEVRAAREEMRKITTVKDPTERKKGGVDRKGIVSESYTEQRAMYSTTATRGGSYGKYGAMGTSEELAKSVNLNTGRDLKLEIDKMDAEQQQTLAELKQSAKQLKDGSRDYSEFAKKYQEFVLINKNSIADQTMSAKELALVEKELAPASAASDQSSEISAAGAQLKKDAGVASPSTETIEASQGMVQGVTQTLVDSKDDVAKAAKQMISPITQASKDSASRSAFGNIDTKEPVPAVGNAPREVVQAMSQEAGSTKSFVGDIKSSFANMRENIARELGWVKEEFKTLTSGVKDNTSAASQSSIDTVQKNLQITEAANNQILINGEKAGFNYVAAMAGRDGAVEAVATKKTADIVRKVTAAWNTGVREIPPIIPKEMSKAGKELKIAGENLKRISVDNEIKRQQAIAGVQGSPAGNVAAGVLPDVDADGVAPAKKSIGEMAQGISNFSLILSTTSGILSMFGGEFSQVAGYLSMASGALFALIQITQSLAKVQMIDLALKKAGNILEAYRAAISAMATAGTLTLGSAALMTGGAIWAMLGPIGLVVAGLALLAGGFLLLNHIAEENKKKIAGLGNAATVAGEKLKLLAELAGFEPTRDPGQRFEEASIGVGAGATREQQTSANDIRQSDKFQEAIADGGIFKADLDALKGAGDNAKIAIETMTANMIALAPEDADPEKIRAVVLALAAEAGLEEVEVNLPMNLNPFVAGNENAVQDFVAGVAADLATNIDKQTSGSGQGKKLSGTGLSDANQLGAAAFAGIQQLETALGAGQLSVGEYKENVAALFAQFEEFDPLVIAAANKKMMESFGVPPGVAAGIKNLEAQQAIIKGLSVGIRPSDDDLGALSKIDSGTEKEKIAAQKILNDLITQTGIKTNEAATAAERLKKAEAAKKKEVDLQLIQDEIDANSIKLEQAEGLIASGMDEADAMAIANDEKFANIFATAKLADEENIRNGIMNRGTTEVQKAKQAYEAYKNSIEAVSDANNRADYATWKKNIEDQNAALTKLEESGVPTADAILLIGNASALAAYNFALANGEGEDWLETNREFLELEKKIKGSGGGSQADPIADAIKALKEQRAEIINTSKAYSALRKRGMDAAKAMRFAQNPQLMAAMNAGLKVGSKLWNEIIKRIQAAEKAARKFQMATTSGQKEYFDEVYGKVENLFSAQENLMRATFAAATEADSRLISKLEGQIEKLNSEIEDYQFALDEIAEKEDAINEEYDKKVKALEEVKRVNEDILRQQKSQLSIAEALSQGDVSAAARAIQESRADNARAALDNQGDLLDTARQTQLDAVRAKNGLSREQIEKRIKELKKEILNIERGELKEARDRVAEAERKLEKDIASLTIHGKTRVQWELIKARTDKAEAAAALYTKEVKRALRVVNKMVRAWEKLKGLAGITVNEDPFVESAGMASGGVVKPSYLAKGGMVKPSYFAKGGMVKPSYFGGGGKVGYYPMGGLIPYKAGGGMFTSVNTDTQPAMLTPGEFVVRRSAVENFGLQNLKNINNGVYGNTLSRGFNQPVYPEISRDYASANVGGGIYSSSNTGESNTQVDNSVYNYNLSVNVEGSDADANEIARVVMAKLRRVGSQQLRGAMK